MSARAHIASMFLFVAGCGGGSAVRPAPAPSPRATVATRAAAPPGAYDRDADGASDAEDACPDQPEDCDGYQDEDGCPDADNDRDRIPDLCDECPDQPETFNGYQDDDGCPDKPIDIIREGQIRIVPIVKFPFGSAKPVHEAQAIVESVAAVMKDHPEIQVVGIVGHAAAGEPHPLELGQRRAKAVEKALEQAGVEASRLEVHSLGSKHPIANPRGHQAAKNRRVEFRLVRQNGEKSVRWTEDGYVEVAPPPAPPPPEAKPRPPCHPPARLPPELHMRCAGRAAK